MTDSNERSPSQSATEMIEARPAARPGPDLGAALFGSELRRLVLLGAGIPGITLPEALPIHPDRADLPETLIGGRERAYLDWFLRRKTANPKVFAHANPARIPAA
jgi:hypothetical protein